MIENDYKIKINPETLDKTFDDLSPGENDQICPDDASDYLIEESPEEKEERLQREESIRVALNQQTLLQYRQYAEEQHPKEIEKQNTLISQLQEQYFNHYMNTVYQLQLMHQQQQLSQLVAIREMERQERLENAALKQDGQRKKRINLTMEPLNLESHDADNSSTMNTKTDLNASDQQCNVSQDTMENLISSGSTTKKNNEDAEQGEDTNQDVEDEESDFDDKEEDDDIGDDIPTPLPLIPASLWTQDNIVEFKKEILTTQRECCINISSLSCATVRVPTHEDGRCLFWEFATDKYDLGFGLYFEWTLAPPENITVNVSESSDEEEDGEGVENDGDGEHRSGTDDDPESSAGDLERGARKGGPRAPTDELIPVYRRDCHLTVHCGSHLYPGCGVYVLKFDNSYSVWRSKWLYYRVYYAR